MTDAVTINKLGFAYPRSGWVFRNYSANVPKGSVFSILGPNGRGKTTLLKTVLGLHQPTEGTVEVSGQTAFVPQIFQVTFAFTVLDMVVMGRAKRIGLFSRPGKEDEQAALDCLDKFSMAEYAHRPFHELSGGQRQLVILARALAAQADILVMDEPTSALDLKNQSLVLDWIARISGELGLTVIFTTHHPHHALAAADNVLLMLDENEYAAGRAGEVLTEEKLERLYSVPLKHIRFEYGGRQIDTFAPVFMPKESDGRK